MNDTTPRHSRWIRILDARRQTEDAMIPVPPADWHDLADPETFNRFYQTLSPDCLRTVGRRYRSLRWQWRIPTADYQEMVADAVTESFLAVRQRWSLPGLERDNPLALLVCVGQRLLLRKLQRLIRYQARQGVDVSVLSATATETPE